jgi:lysyl-tRNA synthetase class 2
VPEMARVRVVSLAVMAAGMLTLSSAVREPWRGGASWLGRWLLPVEPGLASGAVAILGLAVLLVGRAALRRRRVALGLVAGLLLVATLLHLANGLDLAGAAVTGGLAALLLSARRSFVRWRGGGPDAERAVVRTLVDGADGDTLDPFVLRRDKRYAFSADRQAVVGYRYVNGVALAAGDPVGAAGSWPGAVAEFLGLCETNGWRPAWYGVRAEHRDLYAGFGLRSFYLGDEAIVEVGRFTMEGRVMRPVRQAVNRTRNAGVSTEIHREGDLGRQLLAELRRVALARRASGVERGYSMTLDGLLDGDHRDCLIVVCRDRAGHPRAFQRYIPCRAGAALSLDVMRRDHQAPNGVNERMIYAMIEWAREHGVAEMSLNFAAFRQQLGTDPTGATQAVEAWLVRRLDGRFGIQMDSLRRFNAKFQPHWRPRHLVFRSAADLPAIGLAALSAEGFLPFDRSRAQARWDTSTRGSG